jgi:glyoxylase I family protein
MARVTGIGGFFFPRARPGGAQQLVRRALRSGDDRLAHYDDPGWLQERGEPVFSAFSQDSDAFGGLDRTWKINFRVSDLDGMVERRRGAGVTVERHPDPYPNGRFAELADPAGNRTQLWEPNAASLAHDPGGP